MLVPKKQKYRRLHRGRSATKGIDLKGSRLAFGTFGLKAQTAGEITSRQIEAARRTMTRHVKRGGKIWIRIFPDKPITGKPLEVRMGKGKGSVEYWVAPIQPGRVLFEMSGVSDELATEAFNLASAKLPISTTIVKRTVM